MKKARCIIFITPFYLNLFSSFLNCNSLAVDVAQDKNEITHRKLDIADDFADFFISPRSAPEPESESDFDDYETNNEFGDFFLSSSPHQSIAESTFDDHDTNDDFSDFFKSSPQSVAFAEKHFNKYKSHKNWGGKNDDDNKKDHLSSDDHGFTKSSQEPKLYKDAPEPNFDFVKANDSKKSDDESKSDEHENLDLKLTPVGKLLKTIFAFNDKEREKKDEKKSDLSEWEREKLHLKTKDAPKREYWADEYIDGKDESKYWSDEYMGNVYGKKKPPTESDKEKQKFFF